MTLVRERATGDRRTALRVCTPHCGLDPETRLGGEMYEIEVLREMAARGVVFDIVLARGKPHPEDVRNWVIHRLRIARGLRWPVAALVMPPAIHRVWQRARFDVLRVHSVRFIGPAALIARRRYRLDVPIVAHHHHLDASRLNPFIEGPVMRAVERVIVGSDFARGQAAAELGVPPERIAVVRYGVDRGYRPAAKSEALVKRLGVEGKTVALFLGGLEPRKNVGFLLDVWEDVARVRPDAALVVAGTGSQVEALRGRARGLVADGRVVFAGHVPATAKVDYYNAADLLVFPSLMEGFGLVVAEAMSCGLPVVISDRGSLPELVADGEGGFIRDARDRAGFAESILRCLGDARLRATFGAANRERVDRLFRWDRCAAETERVYEEVVDEWRRRPGAATRR
jgi:glycosyltransferase involved in cell wall biosynthesis